ncbi:hybrid sensor histidine kinase/response regulator transcription factor [Arcticibacter eurypsychrophilus]|uniref:hybrid sensor histidine kinase/response regulator transcription factor n=1 Tax=Arcticibacter eurypsychrophilus TaxID=1434752 RepID=UPI00084DD810|nr:hybrid sensor histidine kinase/response regulator transcription factor [Arcticibacter eurypsychrophilus]
MFKKLLKYIPVIFFLTCSSLVFSQENELNFTNLSSREGLSSNIITAILKDSYGYMWFATDDGLNKFDGNKIVVYRHSPGDSSSIPSNDVLDLHEDKKGNLWIGTTAGLVLYNRKMDSFENVYSNYKYSVLSISSDLSGKIWTAGYAGVYVFDPKTRQAAHIETQNSKDRKIVSQPVLKVFSDSKGRIWLSTDKGLLLYMRKNKAFRNFYHTSSTFSIASNSISAIGEDDKGHIWVGTDNGLSMLLPNGQDFQNYHHDPANSKSLSSNFIYSIDFEKGGNIWVGTEEGLNIFDPSKKEALRISRNPRNLYSMVGKAVKAIYIDNNGIYWVATFRGGVNKFDKNLAFFNLKHSNPYDAFGLNADVATSFAEVKGKGVYVGTDGGGIRLFNIKTGLFSPISLNKSPAKGGGLAILAMEKWNSEVWIGTFLNGLYILDSKSGKVRQITKGKGPNSLSGNDIFCLKKDSQGNMWVGTNGQGVDCFDSKKKIVARFNKAAKGSEEVLLTGYIRAIEEDRDGNIWFGSKGAGIAVYNPLTGNSKMLRSENSKLPSNNVMTICSAKNGTVWVGTGGEGLAYYDPRKAEFVSFSVKNGLSNGVIYKILEDAAGVIWVSTNNGLSSFNPRNKKFKNYTYYNGLQRSPFVIGSGLKLADGQLFFGGVDGFNYFNPKNLHTNKNVPEVVLTELRISNKSIQPSESSEITEHISVAREITLDYKQNFSLSFAALNYTSPQENRYHYKLENFDKEWNNVGSVTTAVYTNLDPGYYVFRVKATSDAGEWSTPVTSIKIYVRPPFWLTYYAYALYVIFVLSVLWYMRYSGIRKLRAKFELVQERLQVQQLIEQERREAERLHELDELKIKFLTNLSHEFRTPISLIVGPVEQLLQVETSTSKSSHLNMIRRNARRLLNLVNQLLDFRNLEEKELQLNTTEGDFIAFVRDVAESFKDLSERKHIDFVYRSSVKFYFTYFDRDKIERVIFNLLSNAFKFTLKGGQVSLMLDRDSESEGLKITLSDTGIGIEPSEKDKIFDRFFQSEVGDAVQNKGTGIGLSITREFVKLHGGSIQVDSTTGEGSVFVIRLPFKEIEDIDEVKLYSKEEDIVEESSSEIENENSAVASQLPVILIVEDNEDLRSYLKDNLKAFYKIVEASNGKEGWQKVLSAHPQLVVSDISMPLVSGIELCKKIKSDKRSSHIPVLLLTALAGEEDQVLGLETGANDYMTKPFNFNILNIKIRNLLRLNQQFKNTYSKQIKMSAPELTIESDNEKLLSKAIQYIESNLNNSQLSVEDLSRKIGMSRGSLYTKILELTGESPVEFIRSVKLDRAAILLEKSDMNISQVSYSVGFSTPNYFARAFKTRFNMLPSEYVHLKRGDKGQVGVKQSL